MSDVAADLRAIADMASRLESRAIDRANDRDLPGGKAMSALGPLGSPEAVANRRDTFERWVIEAGDYAKDWDRNPYIEDPEDTWAAEEYVRFWSESWRVELGQDWADLRPTLVTEVGFLRNPDTLAWARANEIHYEDFAADVAKARRKLEDVLSEGERPMRSRVICRNPACEKPKTLVRRYGHDDEMDTWRCPYCRTVYDDTAFKSALAKQMRDQGAERWVLLREAVDALTMQGWQERTVMRWVQPLRRKDRCADCGQRWPDREYAACPGKVLCRGEVVECGGTLEPVWMGDREGVVESWCEIGSRRTMVWWPTMWTRHLVERQHKEAAAIRA